MKAVRDNTTSTEVLIDLNDELGRGTFRITYRGTYTNGQRVQQSAACKKFKPNYQRFEIEYYHYDFKVVNKAIDFAESWNDMVQSKDMIQFNRGDITMYRGTKFIFEPLIQPFYKYTSNIGWIWKDDGKRTSIECLEAFCHYTYHKSGGNMIVCDLQGLYKVNWFAFFKSRYVLTDPAICSRPRSYGPTDMGEKGIESFFANHKCNKFCQRYGNGRWSRPRTPRYWFDRSNNGHTSMMSSSDAYLLFTNNKVRFDADLTPIYEDRIGLAL
jgi:Alpha-kinase family